MAGLTIETSQRQYDVITFGDMCVDLIITGDDVVPQFGQVEKRVDGYRSELGVSIVTLKLGADGARVVAKQQVLQ